MKKTKRTLPYEQRSDLEKIKAQWHKLTGLHSREEWSGAVVRAATAAELAANYAIRQEFEKSSRFTDEFVNHLLLWANGLGGKMDKLLVPLAKGTNNAATMRALKTLAGAINAERNTIVHQGFFFSESKAQVVIDNARSLIERLVRIYKPKFRLKERKR